MSSLRWKLAPVFAMTALMSAGCDDSSSGGPQDLSVATHDMTGVTGDMTVVPPDLLPVAGNGFILAADVSGTAYVESAPDGGEVAVSAHTLATGVQLPVAAGTSAYSDFTSTIAPPVITGCIANRYSLPTNNPQPDTTTAGAVSISGYNTKVVIPGPPSATPPFLPATATSPPAAIACINPTTPLPNYLCFFGSPANRQLVGSGAFPTLPPVNYGYLCSLSGGCAAADCILDSNGNCEQKLFLDGTIIHLAFDGQAKPGYQGSNLNFGVGYNPDGGAGAIPGALRITQITSGGTQIGTSFGDITALDPTADLVVNFSCDGTTTTGSGCNLGSFFDLAVLTAQTSTRPRQQFSQGTVPDFGTLTCIEQHYKKTAFTVKAAALQAMVGTQTGGSVSFSGIQVKAALGNGSAAGGQTYLEAAGRGTFGFANLK